MNCWKTLFSYNCRTSRGDKLKKVLHKNFEEENITESWEISDVDGDQFKVSSGKLAGKTLRELS